jgi:transposase InsO family protein
MGMKQVLSAPRSPWQRAYVERLIGSIRRECLDHVIVFYERRAACDQQCHYSPPGRERCFSPGEPAWRYDGTAMANRLRLAIRPSPSRHRVSCSPSPPSWPNPVAAGPGWDIR